jgi:hypothetical protein
MLFEGGECKAFQRKKHVSVSHEQAKWNPLQSGINGERPASYRAGNNSKFIGLARQRSAPDWPAVRAEREEAAASRHFAHDDLRLAYIEANRNRTGYECVSGTEIAPRLDNFRPRGRV